MAIRTWAPAALIAMALLALVLVGCQDDPSEPEPNPQAFSVSVSGMAESPHALWVVLHDPATRQPFAARRISADGELDFGDTGHDRVSVTFAPVNPVGSSAQSTIYTYHDVPAGHWTWRSTAPSMVRDEPEGLVTVVATLPLAPRESYWAHLTAIGKRQTSRYYPPFSLPAADTVTFTDVYPDPNGTVSIFSWLEGDSGMYCGWQLGQPYLPNQTATFALDLFHLRQSRTITTTAPVSFLEVFGVWGNRSEEIRLDYSYNWTPGKTTNHLSLPVDFPATEYRISARWESGPDLYYADWWQNSVPSALTLPSGQIDGSYDSEAERFSDILYTGEVDAIRGCWIHSSGATLNTWIVIMSPVQATCMRPLLPDSVQTEVWVETTDNVYSPSIGLENFDGLTGYEAYIGLTRTSRPNGHAHLRYSTVHQIDAR